MWANCSPYFTDCDVITLVKFLSVGLLLVNCRLTVGILPADSWPTVYRQSADRLLGELFFTFTEHRDCPSFTVFLTTKSLSQNISITLLQISLKLHEHRGCYWRKKLPWMIFEEQFLVPRYTAVSKIGNSVISLLWQLRCHCNPDHNKFSSLSSTTAVAIFSKLCLWRRSLCSNLGGIGPGKLYRATFRWTWLVYFTTWAKPRVSQSIKIGSNQVIFINW